MSKQQEILVRWFDEVWNQGKRETIDELMGPDCILHDGTIRTTGPAAFKEFFDGLQREFSGVHVDTHEFISVGDLSCVRWSSTLTQRGTGKAILVTGMTMVRAEEGRIAEAWQNWDKLGMVEQLGAPPMVKMHVA